MEERALHRHLSAERLGRALSRPEKGADLGGQHSPTAVVLERDLAAIDAEARGGAGSRISSTSWSSTKWLLGPMVPNRMPGHLHHQPWQLAPDPLGTAVRLDFEAAAFLDPVEVRWVKPESIDGERAPSARTAKTSSAVRSRRCFLGNGYLLDQAVEVLDGGAAADPCPARSGPSRSSARAASVGRIVSRVATAMLEGISMLDL